MLRPDLINRVTDSVLKESSSPEERALVKKTVYAVFDAIVDACMHGDYVAISGFGKFSPRVAKAKVINNGLRRNCRYTIPQRLKLKFRSSETADRVLNEGLKSYIRTVKEEVNA